MIRILFIDDDPKIQKTLPMVLGDKYRVVSAYTGASGLERIEEEEPDVVLLDVDLPDMHGLDVLARIVGKPAHPPVIMLTISTDASIIVSAVRKGAFDFLPKPYEIKTLESAIRCAIQTAARKKPAATEHGALDAIIGESPQMKTVKELIPRWAEADVPVIILGESGTGKELVAQAVHSLSPRASSPFVALNCGAIPETIIEAELFGSEKGAYTDAVKRAGFFEKADGGSIFLDELGEMPLVMQTKLLKVIEDKQLFRVGGNEPVRFNVRIIAATNRNLKERVESGTFRLDLYYRLCVLPIELPALRDRASDIPVLASHFTASISGGKKKISADACSKLASHTWPGNVRELRNVLERACLISTDGLIRQEHIIFT